MGISSQDLASHEAFIAKHWLNVPLLADVDRQVSSSYSAFSSRLGIKRAVIVIDEQGSCATATITCSGSTTSRWTS